MLHNKLSIWYNYCLKFVVKMSTSDLSFLSAVNDWESLHAALQVSENVAEIAKFAAGGSYHQETTGLTYKLMDQAEEPEVFHFSSEILATLPTYTNLGITAHEHDANIMGLLALATYLPYSFTVRHGSELVAAFTSCDHHTRKMPDTLTEEQLAFMHKAAGHLEIGKRAMTFDPASAGKVAHNWSDAVKEEMRGKGIGKFSNVLKLALFYHLGFNMIYRICDNEASIGAGRRFFETGHVVPFESIEVNGVKAYGDLQGGKACQWRHLHPV